MAAHMEQDVETGEIVHIDSAVALTAVERAQVDVQVATAKRYPRDVTRSMREARALALTDEEVAASMLYAMPRDGKVIEGPSARLAEIIAYSWGNLRAETDIESIDDKHITAVGTCFDLEKNVAVRMRVKRRITGKNNKRYSEDMVVVTGNAASSIALRNAVFKVVPGAHWKPIYEDARRLAMGGADSIARRWKVALDWFAKLAVTETQVLAALGRATPQDVLLEDFIILAGLRTALTDGDTTVEDAFPRLGADEEPDLMKLKSRTDELLSKLRGKSAPTAGGNGGPLVPTASVGPADNKMAELLDSQRKALIEWCRRTSPTGGAADEVPAEPLEQARALAAAVFDDGEDRTRVLDFIDMATPPLSDRQFKVLIGKLQIAEQARREYEQPSLLGA